MKYLQAYIPFWQGPRICLGSKCGLTLFLTFADCTVKTSLQFRRLHTPYSKWQGASNSLIALIRSRGSKVSRWVRPRRTELKWCWLQTKDTLSFNRSGGGLVYEYLRCFRARGTTW
jgi:hypothetical protein